MRRAIWLMIGLLSLVLVGVGIVLPMMPYFPFLMLSTFCFAKSSNRLHRWITGTALYQKNLDSFVKGKGMTVAAKIRILMMVTLVMGSGFVAMFFKGLYVPCGILAAIWVMHLLIFIFGIKTYVPTEERAALEDECTAAL